MLNQVSKQYQITHPDNEHKSIEKILRVIHCVEKSIDYMDKCKLAQTLPKCTKIPSKQLQHVNWSKKKLFQERQKKADNIHYQNQCKLKTFNDKLDYLTETHISNLSHT